MIRTLFPLVPLSPCPPLALSRIHGGFFCLLIVCFALPSLAQQGPADPDPLQVWGRASPPKGLWQGRVSEKKTVVYLVRVNNLLAKEPRALQGHPEAAQKIGKLIIEHQESLAQRGVRVKSLIKLLGLSEPGLPGSQESLGKNKKASSQSPEERLPSKKESEDLAQAKKDLVQISGRLDVLADSQVDFGEKISTFVGKQQELRQAVENLSASSNKLAGRLEAMKSRINTQEEKNRTLDEKQQEYDKFREGVLETQEGMVKTQTETLARTHEISASLGDLKSGLASLGVLLDRLSKDIDRLDSQAQGVETLVRKRGTDYDALRQLLRVNQSGSSDLREDVAALTQRLARLERQGEAARPKGGRKLLKSIWLAPAALGVGVLALILAL